MQETPWRKVIELLAPARDAECARVAIDHGADVVYIGAPAFSARKQAGNSIEDIAAVALYAHTFGAKVYVALNTLLFDNEVDEAIRMAWQIYAAGVDALIVQDVALLSNQMPPIALHASTQMSNHTAEKVLFWEQMGLEQVVLDRELSLDEIRAISAKTQVRLEYFVHGALCVSYSGRCYMSQAVCGRSANRGECSQPCRLPYTLRNAQGAVLQENKYLLSLRDNNQTDNLEALIDAGISAFKIEGRLKGPDYVANVVLHYRQKIDEILARRKDLRRASVGRVVAGFEPDTAKSFNRCFTSYFVHGRQNDIWQPHTPKSLGEYIGRAENVKGNSFCINTERKLNNGDGLCYIADNGKSDGLKVNRAENGKPKRVFPLKLNGLTNGARVYRNSNIEFAQTLKTDTTHRVVSLAVEIGVEPNGDFFAQAEDEEKIVSRTQLHINTQVANNLEAAKAQIERQIRKLGGTPYELRSLEISAEAARCFAAAAELNELRRQMVQNHTVARQEAHKPQPIERPQNNIPYLEKELDKSANVLNDKAKAFYESHGSTLLEWGYERQTNYSGAVVMTTRHCILHSLGMCLRRNPMTKHLLPLQLEHGRDKFRLSFNCAKCEMTISKI